MTGPSGANGATGASGAAGATGATGPSSAGFGNIVFAGAIQGAIGAFQTSNSFGGFQARKSYVVRIQIETYNTTKNLATYPLSFSISAVGATPTVYSTYSISNGTNWISGAKQDEVKILAELAIDGSAVLTSYSFSVTVTCGATTTAFPLAISGKYLITEVGQVSTVN
ncbi:MAG: hypothetical protein NTX12_07725 [Actinobacteria bacterium]|nr:hypothetical protein [Actinomycetota bacterium]